ncbi:MULTISPECIES: YueI family protein [unclassified Streptococcus]|uniref:YueI family protein n=1 Tax=unclassified Streptococcus TaxID=2608887 RepID=UPI0018A90F16|nr:MULTISPECIES: YueI family protein [unclassified Streptococcus]MBF8971100.1 YueI family protein [Streptococcus sp. NLN76]MBG9366965.1 YueI family protein [Streptococcus sp. NLN64]MBJ6746696.1 YueI family protein [Streptococcus sp. 121]
MKNLEKTLMEKAAGSLRLDPDQQRKYLGTFQERVICGISIAEAKDPQLKQNLPYILSALNATYTPLYLKISPSIPNDLQLTYLKMGRDQGITSTIVSDESSHSPFGLILHSDHALNLEDTSIKAYLPQKKKESNPKTKKGFFQKLFGG